MTFQKGYALWSIEEVEILKRNSSSSLKTLQRLLPHRTKSSIKNKRYRLGLPALPVKRKFTDEQFLELYNKGFTDRLVAKKLGVAESSVSRRRRKIGLPRLMNQLWTPVEDKILQQDYEATSKEEILKKLPKRTWEAITSRASDMGLKSNRVKSGWGNIARYTRDDVWNNNEIKILRNLYPRASWGTLLSKLPNRTKTAIILKANKLGLERDSDVVYGEVSKKQKGRQFSKETRLKMSAKALERLKDPRKRVPTHHTKPELRFLEICQRYNLPFKYVGDSSFWIENLNPDFIEENGRRICVEIFGVVFHHPDHSYRRIPFCRTEEGRKALLRKYGWQCVVFWDYEIMRDDAEETVLKRLAEEIQ